MAKKKRRTIAHEVPKSKARSESRARSAPSTRRAASRPAAKKTVVRTAHRPKRQALRELYPAIEPYNTGYLKVSDVHEIYFEESGNPRGKPAVFLHGGPGGATDPKMRRFFDPRRYRIVLFDQRGCGKSRPHASLEDNTTWHLVDDIERLREHLDIDRWLVFGGSWGSTLALAYAETYPERVTELVLRGIFLLRRWELEWFYQNPGGAGALYPDLWESYVDVIPPDERGDMINAYYKRLTSTDTEELLRAAKAWSSWEAALSFLHLNLDYVSKFKQDTYAAAFARVECHYFVNGGFLRSENQLIEDLARIRHIPSIIVQGRYDIVCPMKTAWDLHKAWPEATFHVVPDAGHSAFEKGITDKLITATDWFVKTRPPSRTR